MNFYKKIIFIFLLISYQAFAYIDHIHISGKEFINSLNALGNEKVLALLYAQAVYDSYSNNPKYCFPEVLDGDNFIKKMDDWAVDHQNLLEGGADELLVKFAEFNYSCAAKAAQ